MLEVKNISTGYGKKQVLFNISFNVAGKEVVMLTGGNGSGKSTVLKCIYGLLPIWNKDGRIIFNGKDITKTPTSSMVKEGIVYIPQKNNYFESLTVHENFIVSGSLYTKEDLGQREEEVIQLLNLEKYRNVTPFNLSGGERQLLALGIALIHKPKLILFDEPLGGLDKTNTESLIKIILKLKELNVGMLIVEHKKTLNVFASKEYKMYLGKLI
jgi:branched-chain amino acid transport system ATP-binding protein